MKLCDAAGVVRSVAQQAAIAELTIKPQRTMCVTLRRPKHTLLITLKWKFLCKTVPILLGRSFFVEFTLKMDCTIEI